ncbi:hypothetical protein [Leifsonia sp. A12D58]|uniref:hypothetical protein n=1 Tax=Leifsonia sp. A12D58 TaxID=3397674 RepID=UPI0039E17AE0
MIEWFAWIQIAIATLAGVMSIVLGLVGRKPNDLTMGATLLVEILLIVQFVVALIAPALGNAASGSLLEFYVYLVSAILLPIAAGFWALIDRSKWSTVILGVGCLSVAVMLYRMLQIWNVQVG